MKSRNSLRQAVIFTVLLLAFRFGGGYLLTYLFKRYNISITATQSILITQIGFLLIPMLLYFLITRNPIQSTLKLYPISFPCILKLILFGICIQPSAMVISAIGNSFFTNYTSQTLASIAISIPYPVMLVLTALCPAILEEAATRGIMLAGFKDKLILPAALFNGLVFAILHGNIQQGLYAFYLGFIFVYLVEAAGSLAASMIVHFVINGCSAGLIYGLLNSYDSLTGYYASTEAQTAIKFTTGEALLAVLIVFVVVGVSTYLAWILYKSIKNQGRTFFKNRSHMVTL